MSTLRPITCPSCGGQSFEHDADHNLICSHCGTKFASPREDVTCPVCTTANPADAMRCMKCGTFLGKVCPVCNHHNAPGTEICINCGAPLDRLTSVASRTGEGKQQSNALREKELVRTKGADMLYMQERRQELDAAERERLAHLAAQRQEALRQQRTLVIVSAIVVLVLMGLGALASLLLFTPQ